MNGDAMLRVKGLFLAATELEASERAAFLDRQEGLTPAARAKIDALLLRHGAVVEPEESSERPAFLAYQDDESEPEVIGPYRVLRRLGEGGMGVVYLAEQTTPLARQVAVKLIKRGMDSESMLRRFEAERQALERMDHPAIARVVDAGLDPSGRPYFAMEFVDGISIIKYCDHQRLDPEARLRLFVEVCQGVQHAHQKGVLHRDLKPNNVLVATVDGRPVPKIIDFGVAKALGRATTQETLWTQIGMIIGTPEYMSPEQAIPDVGDVDTRSDVYSLGVLLYELLSGQLPFDPAALRESGIAGMQRVLKSEDPPRPSTRVSARDDGTGERARQRRMTPRSLASRLRGDLDWITDRALRKRREERYASCSELASDIERHLRDEPVVAGPPTLAYRAAKLARRYRSQLAAALLVAAALLAGTVVATRLALDARALSRELAGARNDVLKEKQAVLGVLDRALGRANGRAADSMTPLEQARLRATLGEAYAALGQHAEAGDQLSAASQLLEESPEARPEEAYAMLRPFLLVHHAGVGIGRRQDFQGKFRRLANRMLVSDEPELHAALKALTRTRGRDDSGEAFAEVLRLAEERLAAQDPRWAVVADLLTWEMGRVGPRGPLLRVLEIYRAHGCDPMDPGWLWSPLRVMQQFNLTGADAHREAKRLADEALSVVGPSLPRGHWYLGIVLKERGVARAGQGRLEDAESDLRASLRFLEPETGREAAMTIRALVALVDCLDQASRSGEADELRSDLAVRINSSPAGPAYAWIRVLLRSDSGEVSRVLAELDQSHGDFLAQLELVPAVIAACRGWTAVDPEVEAAVGSYLASRAAALSGSGAPSQTLRSIYAYVTDVHHGVPGCNSAFAGLQLAEHAHRLGEFRVGQAAAERELALPAGDTEPLYLGALRCLAGLCAFEEGGGPRAIDQAIAGYRGLVDVVGEDHGTSRRMFGRLLAALRRDGQASRGRALVEGQLARLATGLGGEQGYWSCALHSMAELGDYALAERAVEALDERSPGSLSALQERAWLAAFRYDRPRAIQFAEASRSRAPGLEGVHTLMANLYCRLGMLEEMEACVAHARELVDAPWIRNNHAVWRFRLGLVEESRDMLEALVRDEPRFGLAHASLSNSQCALGDLDGALASARRAHELEPWIGQRALGRVLHARGENALARLTAEWPDEPYAWSTRAWILCTRDGGTEGDLKAALDCAQRAVEASGGQGPVMLAALAEAEYRLGHRTLAVAAMARCLAVMDGRNAEWLTVEEARRRRSKFSNG